MSPSLEMKVRPVWDEVERVRNETMAFLEQHAFSEETVQSLGMVASELCENAVKYGCFSGHQENSPIIEVIVRFNEQRSRVLVRVIGPVQIGNNPHFRRFKETLDWLQSHENPMEAYLEKMQAVALTDPMDSKSGLGLPRIAYEGQSLLSYELDDHDRLAVSAVHYPGRV
ncbi:MAG: hypothetical protein RIF32_23035 [Leptospirales bacterium]